MPQLRFRRYELKYPIGPAQIERVRRMTAPFTRPDDFACSRPGCQYTVRSIYFDTPNLRFYHEKDAGLNLRKKLRIRTYDQHDERSVASVEIKRKVGVIILKERILLPFDVGLRMVNEGRAALEGLELQPGGRDSLLRFMHMVEMLRLEPAVLITYEREAYVGRENSRERLTIDKYVRSIARPRADEWHAENGYRYLSDRVQILELKFDGLMPRWMRPITAYLDKSHRPISKYCKGIDLWGPEAFQPGIAWSR
jgi:hypothetical protein